MSKLENVGQKLYLNHFQIVTTLTFLSKKKHVKRETKITLQGLQIKRWTMKLMEVLGVYPEMCKVGPVAKYQVVIYNLFFYMNLSVTFFKRREGGLRETSKGCYKGQNRFVSLP